MNILTDILHPSRLKIMKLIEDKPKSLSNIAKDLDLSKPEISRHLTRLRELGLIAKVERSHFITNLGENILNIISPLDFLLKHYEYFLNHQIIDLPVSLIRDIDSLMNSELIAGTGYIFSGKAEFQQRISNEFKLMVDQPFPENNPKKIDDLYLIVPSRAKTENLNLSSLKEHNNYFEIRTVPVINYCLGIADNKHGFIFFPDLSGKIDYNFTFSISDSLGISFLIKLWSFFWERAKFRVSSKTLS